MCQTVCYSHAPSPTWQYLNTSLQRCLCDSKACLPVTRRADLGDALHGKQCSLFNALEESALQTSLPPHNSLLPSPWLSLLLLPLPPPPSPFPPIPLIRPWHFHVSEGKAGHREGKEWTLFFFNGIIKTHRGGQTVLENMGSIRATAPCEVIQSIVSLHSSGQISCSVPYSMFFAMMYHA